MIAMTMAELAQVTGGRLLPGTDADLPVSGPVVIDSRLAASGGLFVCLVGEHVDGHEFAEAAVAAGAVGVLAGRPVAAPGILVGDVTAALSVIARAVHDRSSATVVGVTGSSGKTSTKDLIAQVLEADAPTVAPRGSFNNELGLPLTVCEITPETRWLVCEFSARGAGHIASLTRVAPPTLAAVLNVGRAHLGEFGTVDAIAAAKGELVEALPAHGTAVLNLDDPRVAAMRDRTCATVVGYGVDPAADVRIHGLALDDHGRPAFRLSTPAGETRLELSLSGAHNASNAAATVALGLAAGLSLDAITAALLAAGPRSPHRMDVRHRPDGTVVIDDAYNANPESMAAGIEALARIPARRRWAVLGVMRELGADSEALHEAIGRMAAERGIDEVVAVGPDAAAIAAGAAAVSRWAGAAATAGGPDEVLEILDAGVRAGDAVLVKASNSERLWRVADRLVAAPAVDPPSPVAP